MFFSGEVYERRDLIKMFNGSNSVISTQKTERSTALLVTEPEKGKKQLADL